MDKNELIITALQQRIGELSANYETQIALLRAELTIMAQEKQEKEEAISQYNQELSEKINSAN